METKQILEMVETLDPVAVVNKLLAEDVTVGKTVTAVGGEQPFAYDGQKGVVRSIDDKGYANVEFPDGAVVPLLRNLLIPV